MTRVTLQDVRKRYADGVVALDGVSLSVRDGEFLVVVGPSGCGKSTTLRSIAGLESVTDGDIEMGDRSVVGVDPADRSVAMVFQNYALYPHMSARRNITFGMHSVGSFTDDEIDARVREAADVLDIGDLLDRKPQALSGGERQRVALGRALVRDPDVFLLDEPLSNLDAKLRMEMRAELAKLHEEFGTTTVYVTHDQTEAMTLGDRVAVMNEGTVQQVAPPQELYDRPATRFVAEFIGEPAMNVFPVDVAARDDRRVATRDGLAVTLPTDDGDPPPTGPALLGVRPENVVPASTVDTAPDTFSATVTVTEPLGDELSLECRVGDRTIRARAPPRTDIAPGEEVILTCDNGRLHLFDRDTGDAVYHAAGATAERRAVADR